jgi:hypothetical protein
MSRFSQIPTAGGFRLDSPVKVPVASEMLRSAPPYTNGAGEEPCQGGLERRDRPFADLRDSVERCDAAAPERPFAATAISVLQSRTALTDGGASSSAFRITLQKK